MTEKILIVMIHMDERKFLQISNGFLLHYAAESRFLYEKNMSIISGKTDNSCFFNE